MRIMGIDYGTRRIGVALGDTESGVATPLRVVENEGVEEAVDRVGGLAREESAEALVIGVPQTPGGKSASETAKEVLTFIEKLRADGFTVHEENEMLSSKVAAVQSAESGSKEKRDDLAAMTILQTYLDRMSRE